MSGKNNEKYNWKAAVDENVRSGFTELLILQLLSEKDMYGYEMKREIIRRTLGAITFGESPLYIPLLRMAERGLISSRRELVTGKRFRTYYHIEEDGLKCLKYGKKQCDFVFNGITNLFYGEKGDEDQEDD